MQPLVGLLCFSLLLTTGTCLECEHCTGFNKDCTGPLQLCNEDQDTCATILTETTVGKVSSFAIIKSCYQASKCLRSSKEFSFIKVNVDIECTSSPAGKMESEGGKAPVHWNNELPNHQLRADVFNRPKSRAAVELNTNLGDLKLNAREVTEPTKPTPEKPTPAPEKPNPTSEKPNPTTEKPNPTTEKPKPTPEKPNPTTEKPKPTPEKPKLTSPLIETTTGDNAHQTVASFLLSLSSLLLMNIFL